MQNILLVDGYNMIGAWKELRSLRDENFEDARDRLVELMAEYKAVKGWRVIIVFDAHLVKGSIEKKENVAGVEVVYTKEYETAAQLLEQANLYEPDNVSTLYYLGKAYQGLEQFDQAKELYNRIIQEFPNSNLVQYAKIRLGEM